MKTVKSDRNNFPQNSIKDDQLEFANLVVKDLFPGAKPFEVEVLDKYGSYELRHDNLSHSILHQDGKYTIQTMVCKFGCSYMSWDVVDVETLDNFYLAVEKLFQVMAIEKINYACADAAEYLHNKAMDGLCLGE